MWVSVIYAICIVANLGMVVMDDHVGTRLVWAIAACLWTVALTVRVMGELLL